MPDSDSGARHNQVQQRISGAGRSHDPVLRSESPAKRILARRCRCDGVWGAYYSPSEYITELSETGERGLSRLCLSGCTFPFTRACPLRGPAAARCRPDLHTSGTARRHGVCAWLRRILCPNLRKHRPSAVYLSFRKRLVLPGQCQYGRTLPRAAAYASVL